MVGTSNQSVPEMASDLGMPNKSDRPNAAAPDKVGKIDTVWLTATLYLFRLNMERRSECTPIRTTLGRKPFLALAYLACHIGGDSMR